MNIIGNGVYFLGHLIVGLILANIGAWTRETRSVILYIFFIRLSLYRFHAFDHISL